MGVLAKVGTTGKGTHYVLVGKGLTKGSKGSRGTTATKPPRTRQTRHADVWFDGERCRVKKDHTADALSPRFSESPERKSSLEFLATDPSRTSFRDCNCAKKSMDLKRLIRATSRSIRGLLKREPKHFCDLTTSLHAAHP